MLADRWEDDLEDAAASASKAASKAPDAAASTAASEGADAAESKAASKEEAVLSMTTAAMGTPPWRLWSTWQQTLPMDRRASTLCGPSWLSWDGRCAVCLCCQAAGLDCKFSSASVHLGNPGVVNHIVEVIHLILSAPRRASMDVPAREDALARRGGYLGLRCQDVFRRSVVDHCPKRHQLPTEVFPGAGIPRRTPLNREHVARVAKGLGRLSPAGLWEARLNEKGSQALLNVPVVALCGRIGGAHMRGARISTPAQLLSCVLEFAGVI